jgi:hypothetical protein
LGKQAVGLLQGMGYKGTRHYVGGMADWVENRGPVEKIDVSSADVSPGQFIRAQPSKTWRDGSTYLSIGRWTDWCSSGSG